MRLVPVIIMGAIIISLCAPAFGIVNSGFESSVLEDGIYVPLYWDREYYVSVVDSFSPDDATGSSTYWQISSELPLMPFEGDSFVVLSSGDIPEFDSPYGKISQSVTIHEGEKLSGVFFFGTCDYFSAGNNNDYATISLLAEEGSGLDDIEVVRVDVESIGDYSSNSGWVYFESDVFTAANAGLYTLEIAVYDDGDLKFNSYFMIDNLYIPEPATLLLLGAGGALITVRRRR